MLTTKETQITLIRMDVDPSSGKDAPKEIEQLQQPLIRRQVWIKNDELTLAWAESWWNNTEVNLNLPNKREPIWKNLTKDRSELFREVDAISLVDSKLITKEFGIQGPYWSRNYRFFRNKRPLTIIREVFNPYIEKWIGYSGSDKFLDLCSTSS